MQAHVRFAGLTRVRLRSLVVRIRIALVKSATRPVLSVSRPVSTTWRGSDVRGAGASAVVGPGSLELQHLWPPERNITAQTCRREYTGSSPITLGGGAKNHLSGHGACILRGLVVKALDLRKQLLDLWVRCISAIDDNQRVRTAPDRLCQLPSLAIPNIP